MSEFPHINGFSTRILKYIRQWFLFYSAELAIGQQLVAQLTQIPWGHHIAIISKTKDLDEAIFYVDKIVENNWFRSVLTHQIESNLFQRHGKAIINFEATLPAPHSDLARETTKAPYHFDFLALRDKYKV